jgi:hypothetical protein
LLPFLQLEVEIEIEIEIEDSGFKKSFLLIDLLAFMT